MITLDIIFALRDRINDDILINIFRFSSCEDFLTLLIYIIYLKKELPKEFLTRCFSITQRMPTKKISSKNNFELTSQKAKTEDNILLKNKTIDFNLLENKKYINNFRGFKEIVLNLEEFSISESVNENKIQKNLFKNLDETYNLEVHILALVLSKIKDTKLSLVLENTFDDLQLKLLSYCFKSKTDENFVDLEIQILEFLFIANETEKRELQVLYEYIKSDFTDETDSIYLQTHKKIINIIYNLN